MEKDEIRRCLDASVAHSAVVDVREVEEAPGYLRTVTIHDDLAVTIEYQKCADYRSAEIEGGGLKYVGAYEHLDEAIHDLEEFLGSPMTSWRNYLASPYAPSVLEELDPAKNVAWFEAQVRAGTVPLPRAGSFEISGIHWEHVALFGEYRPDRLGEETEIRLRKRGLTDE